MLGSKELEGKMTALERNAWQSFRNVVHGFLGRNKAENYEDLVETTANILQAWEQDVTKNALLAFSLGFFWQMCAKSMVNSPGKNVLSPKKQKFANYVKTADTTKKLRSFSGSAHQKTKRNTKKSR